jgi:hypothetical protein
LGRPDHVQLIFDRRVTKRTPGRFRTRVITEGVVPSLHIDYKQCRIKQYHKEGRALRTETTINDTRDFAIGKRLSNLPALRQVGFLANRRLLDVQQLSCACTIGEAALTRLTQPQVVDQQRVPALRLDDPRVHALFSALVLFTLLPHGFTTKDLRAHLAPMLGLDPGTISAGRMSYDLRRLRLHGIIARLPGTQRYRPTPEGLRTALFCSRLYARVLRPGLAQLLASTLPDNPPLRAAFDRFQTATDHFADRAFAAA